MSAFSDLENAKKTVAKAIELGINYIDTAPGYGNSEEVLGKALAGIQAPVVLSTKLGGRPEPFEPQNADALRRSVDESLKLLGRDYIDILMIHEPDRPGQHDWWSDFAKVEGPVIGVLEDLKRQGIIRYTGLGGTTVTELTYLVKSGKFDVVLTAFNYSILWREAGDSVIPAAKERDMGVVIGSPLQQGALSVRYDYIFDDAVYWVNPKRKAQYKALYALVEETEMTLAEMATRFVISNPQVDCVLTGSKSSREVEWNVEAVERGPLDPETLARLDEIAAILPCRPYEESSALGWHLSAQQSYKGPGWIR